MAKDDRPTDSQWRTLGWLAVQHGHPSTMAYIAALFHESEDAARKRWFTRGEMSALITSGRIELDRAERRAKREERIARGRALREGSP